MMASTSREVDALVVNAKGTSINDISRPSSYTEPNPLSKQLKQAKDSKSGQSTYGPLHDPKARFRFYVTACIMVFCAANNDFLGKLTYQTLPINSKSTTTGFVDMLWIAWLLSFGTFFVCSFGMIIGWNHGTELMKLKTAGLKVWSGFFFAGCCHVWMNGCRYIGLLFLPAPVVTILKSGSQLLFSSMLRYIVEKKQLVFLQKIGVSMTCLGLCFVIIPVYINGTTKSLTAHIIGVILLLSVGFMGAIRNYFEQTFLRMNLNVNFVVGLRSFSSLLVTALIGVILWLINIPNALKYVWQFPFFLLCFGLFLLAIFCKNISQMSMIKQSSAVTRNLFMQIVPSITWILSLIIYYIIFNINGDTYYGEGWKSIYDLFRLFGFCVVFTGSFLFFKHKKK